MKEWLLKEEKNKVGRPKLANEDILKKARISIVLSLLLCFLLTFSFVSILKETSPIDLAYHLTFEKIFGAIENKNGFIVKYKYNNDSNYVIDFSVSSSVDSYSGNYKYTLYEMNGNNWKEKETKEFEKGTDSFKVTVDSLKNQNKTWKIKLQITNASKITESYAPSGWSFVNAKENENMYAYKIFTVKGYYSPVMLDEIKEAKKSPEKITVETKKNTPRSFILNLPKDNSYDVKVSYTDVNSKNIILSNDKGINDTKIYSVPNLNKSTLVTFKIYSSNISDLKLSNWKEEIDKNEKTYITNTYVLKPENAY